MKVNIEDRTEAQEFLKDATLIGKIDFENKLVTYWKKGNAYYKEVSSVLFGQEYQYQVTPVEESKIPAPKWFTHSGARNTQRNK